MHNIIILIILLCTASSQFFTAPQDVVQAQGLEADFVCFYSPAAIDHIFTVNGTSFSNISYAILEEAELRTQTMSSGVKKLSMLALPNYNRTQISCIALLGDENSYYYTEQSPTAF